MMVTILEEKIKQNKENLIVFAGTVLAGLLVHLFMFTNKLYNYFEMNNILTEMSYDKGDTLAMGRWFLPIVSKISSVVSMPVVNGLICLICLGIAAVLIKDMLEIRGCLLGILLGSVLVSFPGVASYLSYGVNCDVFSVAFLLAIIAAYIPWKFGAVSVREEADDKRPTGAGRRIVILSISAIILALCIATYQPFMSVTIALIFARVFLDVCNNGIGIVTFIKKAGLYLSALIVGFVLYYVILKVFNAVMQIEVGNYHGINEMTSFTIKGIAKGFVYTYLYFFRYLFDITYTGSVFLSIMNGIMSASFIGFGIMCCIRNHKAGNTILIVVMMLFLPVGVNACPFLMADRVGNGVDRYMMFSMMLLFALLIAFISFANQEKDKQTFVLQWAAFAGVFALVICDSYIINQTYFRADAMTKSENNYLNRLVGRIEDFDGYTADTPVYIVGAEQPFNENAYSNELLENLALVEGTEIKPWYNYDALIKYMEVYMNFTVTKVSKEFQEQFTLEAMTEGTTLHDLPVYPAKGSMVLVDDILIIKMNQVELPDEEE